MRSRVLRTCFIVAICTVVTGLWQTTPVRGASVPTAGGWDRQAAAQYLDAREVWWQEWPKAQRDHGTICISCHTVVPYALARPGLSRELHEAEQPAPEKVLWQNLEKRVNGWAEMVPFYSDAANGPGKTATSHATEAVLNAVLLASYDAGLGSTRERGMKRHLRSVTRSALDAAWALQQETGELAGGWIWQDFHLGPWEGGESGYQGAAMLMMAVGAAPDGYAKEPAVRVHMDKLKEFLRRQYATQPAMNQLYVLWASSYVPGLLNGKEKKELLGVVRGLEESDGGWRLSAMDKKERADHTAQPLVSDGYATGLVVLVMAESGVSGRDAGLRRGVEWLQQHQEKDGHWPAASLNKQRAPESAAAPFMNDAATGYAVLALERVR